MVPRPKLKLFPKALGELQEPAKLREAGFELPGAIQNQVRVFDTRLHPGVHTNILSKLAIVTPDTKVRVVGGDFLTAASMEVNILEEKNALNPDNFWGHPGETVWVNPGKIQTKLWMEMAKGQLEENGPDQMVFAFFIPREKAITGWDITQVIPPLKILYEVPNAGFDAILFPDRVPIRRIPKDTKRLPPPRWDESYSSPDKVLCTVVVNNGVGEKNSNMRWVGDAIPQKRPSLLDPEVLVAEMVIPNDAKPSAASHILKREVKKVAMEQNLEVPHLVGQPEVKGVFSWAKINVPREQAARWLQMSGHKGLFFRPYFSPSTGADLLKENFNVRWLKLGAPMLTEAVESIFKVVSPLQGVCGLVFTGEIGVRVAAAQGPSHESLKNALNGLKVEVREYSEAKWWCLEHLTESETFPAQADKLISELGLKRQGDARVAHEGPYKWKLFFRATGTPQKYNLDTGARDSTLATLKEGSPPPKRVFQKRQNQQPSAPSLQFNPSKYSLPSTSIWGSIQFQKARTLEKRQTAARESANANVAEHADELPETTSSSPNNNNNNNMLLDQLSSTSSSSSSSPSSASFLSSSSSSSQSSSSSSSSSSSFLSSSSSSSLAFASSPPAPSPPPPPRKLCHGRGLPPPKPTETPQFHRPTTTTSTTTTTTNGGVPPLRSSFAPDARGGRGGGGGRGDKKEKQKVTTEPSQPTATAGPTRPVTPPRTSEITRLTKVIEEMQKELRKMNEKLTEVLAENAVLKERLAAISGKEEERERKKQKQFAEEEMTALQFKNQLQEATGAHPYGIPVPGMPQPAGPGFTMQTPFILTANGQSLLNNTSTSSPPAEVYMNTNA